MRVRALPILEFSSMPSHTVAIGRHRTQKRAPGPHPAKLDAHLRALPFSLVSLSLLMVARQGPGSSSPHQQPSLPEAASLLLRFV